MKSEETGPSLLAAFARVPDVRSRLGRRYAVPALLTLAMAAMPGACGRNRRRTTPKTPMSTQE